MTLRVVVVEDEAPAREKLIAAIRSTAPDVEIAAALGGAEEAAEWFARNEPPGLLFLDVQLGDGSGFDILRRVPLRCPVVFATAFDDYVMEAFRAGGIDYLLKPVRVERVAEAIAKYRALGEHFRRGERGAPRERLLVRKGADLLPLRTADLAYLYTEDKLVFAVLRGGGRYVLDRPLAEWEAELDAARFFRATRAYLVSIDAVVRCRPYGKGKLLLDLLPPAAEEVIVSQERAASFRQWLGA